MRARRRIQHPGRESRHKRVDAGVLLRTLSRFDRKGGLRLVRLWRAWEDVVGPEIAELCRPLGHREATLVLHAQDAMAAQQLSYYTFELLEKVNAFLGEEVFDKVRFELLDGRVPLGENLPDQEPARPYAPQIPKNLGGLLGKIDPDSAVGRCYLAYVRRFAGQTGHSPAEDANTRPNRASRRRT